MFFLGLGKHCFCSTICRLISFTFLGGFFFVFFLSCFFSYFRYFYGLPFPKRLLLLFGFFFLDIFVSTGIHRARDRTFRACSGCLLCNLRIEYWGLLCSLFLPMIFDNNEWCQNALRDRKYHLSDLYWCFFASLLSHLFGASSSLHRGHSEIEIECIACLEDIPVTSRTLFATIWYL